MTVPRLLARYAYVPTMIVGLNITALSLVAAGYSLLWIGLVFVTAVTLSLLAERILPYEQTWNHAHSDVGKDVAHGVFYEVANIAAILLLPVVTMLVPSRGLWPTNLPLALQLLMAIIIVDFCLTIVHYWSHRLSWLWKLHAVHHGVHRLYSFNGLVRHPLHQLLDLSVGTMPLVLIGLPVEIGALLALVISVQLLVQHANVDYALGPFQKFLAIGPVHRLHHVNWVGQGDVNFGLFFTCWDRVLGTLKLDSDRLPSVGDVGIQNQRRFPQHYTTQLMSPFTKSDAGSSAMASPKEPTRLASTREMPDDRRETDLTTSD